MDKANPLLSSTLLLVFAAAIFGGSIAKKLGQPVIVGYVLAGIVAGAFFSRVIDQGFLSFVSDAGITLLLFTLGIEFSFHRLKRGLHNIIWVSLLQIILCVGVYFLFFVWIGMRPLAALFIAASASLSSTALVVKTLGERGQLESLPGEISVAWLVIQDLSVIPIMIILTALASVSIGGWSPANLLTALAISVLKAGIFLVFSITLGHQLVSRIVSKTASVLSRELFILIILGLVFMAVSITVWVGLPASIGAFLAGLLIAETSQKHEFFAEIRPLRDILAVVFFVSLGLSIQFALVLTRLPLILFSIILICLFKWFLVKGLSQVIGIHKKSAFLSAIYLVPLSEFGFILGQEGVRLGVLLPNQYAFLVAIVLGSIFIGAPLMARAHSLYYHFAQVFWGGACDISSAKQAAESVPSTDHIVLCGYGRVGKYIGRALELTGIPFVVIDYDYATTSRLRERGVISIYGDPAERTTLEAGGIGTAKTLIIAIPDRHTQELVIGHARSLNRRIRIICRIHHEEDQKDLIALGVNSIIQPEFEASVSIVVEILTDLGVSSGDISDKVKQLKREHGLLI